MATNNAHFVRPFIAVPSVFFFLIYGVYLLIDPIGHSFCMGELPSKYGSFDVRFMHCFDGRPLHLTKKVGRGG